MNFMSLLYLQNFLKFILYAFIPLDFCIRNFSGNKYFSLKYEFLEKEIKEQLPKLVGGKL